LICQSSASEGAHNLPKQNLLKNSKNLRIWFAGRKGWCEDPKASILLPLNPILLVTILQKNLGEHGVCGFLHHGPGPVVVVMGGSVQRPQPKFLPPPGMTL